MHNRQVTSDPEVPPAEPVEPSPRPRSWLGPLVGVIAFVVVVGIASLFIGDWLARNSEATRLVDRIEASEASMIAFQADVDVALAALGDPQSATPEQIDAFNSALQGVAAEDLPAIESAGADVAAVSVLPWHSELAQARDAYAEHNAAWQEYLTAMVDDPAVFSAPQNRINDSFMAAEEIIRAAMPDPALFDIDSRIEVIFAPPAIETTGPTQQV